MRLARKRNEDEDSPHKLYTLVTYVPVTTFKGKISTFKFYSQVFLLTQVVKLSIVKLPRGVKLACKLFDSSKDKKFLSLTLRGIPTTAARLYSSCIPTDNSRPVLAEEGARSSEWGGCLPTWPGEGGGCLCPHCDTH